MCREVTHLVAKTHLCVHLYMCVGEYTIQFLTDDSSDRV